MNTTAIKPHSNTSIYILFSLVILTWSISWPVNKIALGYMPPDWYAALRTSFSCIFFFVAFSFTGQVVWPSKRDLPLILSIGILQIGLYLFFIATGLNYSEPGRSAILAYTTPIWVSPIATIFFKERLSWQKVVGLILVALGILVMFSPFSMNWHNTHLIYGNLLILASAITWAFALICGRYLKWYRQPAELISWQFLIASIPLMMVALIFNPHPHIQWTHQLIGAMTFIVLLTTAFAYWGMITVTKSLPVITTSLGLVAVPMLSLVASHFALGETLSSGKLLAMGCIMMGLLFGTVLNRG